MANTKKVKLRLQGLDGNAFAIMGAFSRQAKKEKWTQEEIDAVLKDAKSGNYDHLLQVMIAHTEDPGGSTEFDDNEPFDADDSGDS